MARVNKSNAVCVHLANSQFVKMKLRCYYEAKRLTRELQEIGFVTEDQVVVGNEVEEPDVQLLRIMALEVNNRNVLGRKQTFHSKEGKKGKLGVTFARRSSRITLMPVDASSLLGML